MRGQSEGEPRKPHSRNAQAQTRHDSCSHRRLGSARSARRSGCSPGPRRLRGSRRGLERQRGGSLALHYRPDVALMETSLPGLDGLTATRRIREEAPEVRVLILSRDDGEDVQLQALQAGAAGFISKNVPVETMSRVVESVVRGEAAISRRVTMRLIERLRHLPEGGVGMRPVRSPLTEREWEVLDLLCQGKNPERLPRRSCFPRRRSTATPKTSCESSTCTRAKRPSKPPSSFDSRYPGL